MLLLIMIMINADEYTYGHKLSERHVALMVFILLMLLTWFLAFFGAYKSSLKIIGIIVVLWTICIGAWIGLSVLTIVANKKFCLSFETRCPPSLWLFENGSGTRPKLKSTNVNINLDPTTENPTEITTRLKPTKTTEKSEQSTQNPPKKRLSLIVRPATTKTFPKNRKAKPNNQYGYNGTIPQLTTNFVHMDRLLGHKKRSSLFPLQYVADNDDNDDGDSDDADDDNNNDDDDGSEDIDNNGDFSDNEYLEDTTATTTTLTTTGHYEYQVDPYHKNHRHITEEKMHKHFITIVFFLTLFVYAWLVLVSYFMELKCIYDCRCDVQSTERGPMV